VLGNQPEDQLALAPGVSGADNALGLGGGEQRLDDANCLTVFLSVRSRHRSGIIGSWPMDQRPAQAAS
jgi:hypothetical protein